MKLQAFGRYVLLERIAAGGMAEVYLARERGQGAFERLVAIKRILPELGRDRRFIRLFLEEARIAALLNHQNVVQVHDFGETDQCYFLAMEYVHGVSLAGFIERGLELAGNVPLPVAVQVIEHVCAGLDYAHNRTGLDGQPLHIVHRDVSPQNVLVSQEGEVKIADFGIARATSAHVAVAHPGTVRGKYAYMAPELILGRPVDARADIFAVGVLLFEMCTGKRLFRGNSDEETIHNVIMRDLDPCAYRPDMPRALGRTIRRALAKNPDDRHQTAADLLRELEGFCAGVGWPTGPGRLKRYVQSLFPQRRDQPSVVCALPGLGLKTTEFSPASEQSGFDSALTPPLHDDDAVVTPVHA